MDDTDYDMITTVEGEEMYSDEEIEVYDAYDDREDQEALQNALESKPDFRRFWCLSVPEAAQQMDTIVHSTSLISGIPQSICRLLLMAYKWDNSNLILEYGSTTDPIKFYEKSNLAALGECFLSLNHQMRNESDENQEKIVDCPVCLGEVSVNECAEEDCGHIICLDCWRSHFRHKVEKEGNGVKILCPVCPYIVCDRRIREILPDEKFRDMLVSCQVNSFVDTNPFLTWCPGPKCTNVIIRTETLIWSPGPVVCKSCEFESCASCKKEWHAPLICEFVDKWEKEIGSNDRTNEWIQGNSKPCPKCKAPIEKNGGCNAMRCDKPACGHSFCWICLGPVHQYNYDETCSNVDPEALKAFKAKRQMSNQELQRFVFHTDRYLNHMKSMNLESKLYEHCDKVLRQAVSTYGSKLPNMDTLGVMSSVKTLQRCRRMLAWGYAFSYYLPNDSKSSEKILFDQNLNGMHVQTEKLSFLLEQELEEAAKKDCQTFEKIRKEIVDKGAYCDGRRLKLVTHVLENYANGTWTLSDVQSKEQE